MFTRILFAVVFSLIVSSLAHAKGDEFLNDTFYRCGDYNSPTEPSVDLSRFKTLMKPTPRWSFDYLTKTPTQDPKRPIAMSISCLMEQVIEQEDGYLFKGNDGFGPCTVKVTQKGNEVISIQYKDQPAIKGCNWQESDEDGHAFTQADLLSDLAQDHIPFTPKP